MIAFDIGVLRFALRIDIEGRVYKMRVRLDIVRFTNVAQIAYASEKPRLLAQFSQCGLSEQFTGLRSSAGKIPERSIVIGVARGNKEYTAALPHQRRCQMNVHHRRGLLFVWAAAALFIAVYIWLDLNKLHALRIGSNTGSYLQGTINFLHHGSTFDYGDWHPETAQHDQWMMLLLVPFVALWPAPETLIVVQVVSIALAAPLLYGLARRFGAGDAAATIVACAYLISPSVQGFAYGEFVPLDFVPILSCALVFAVVEKKLVWALAIAQLLTGTKEDVALFVAWFGLVCALLYDRRIGVAVLLLGAVNFGGYEVSERLSGVAAVRPPYGLRDPAILQQLAFFAEILAPFAFAPLRLGWRVLLAAPLAAELMFAQGWPFPLYQAGVYYDIPLIAVIAIASAYVVARTPRFAQVMPATAVVMALAFNVTVLHPGRRPFSVDPQYAAAAAWAHTSQPVVFPCDDQGAWVVASPNVNAKLGGCSQAGGLAHTRPAWKDVPLNSSAAWTRGPRAGTALHAAAR